VATALIIYFLGFLSVYFTKLITFRMAYLCGVGNVKNLIIFLTMLFVNFLMLFWGLATTTFREIFLFMIMHFPDNIIENQPEEQIRLQFQ
jgi:hypothetical protein